MEYQERRLLKSLDIPVPQGEVASTPAEAGAYVVGSPQEIATTITNITKILSDGELK